MKTLILMSVMGALMATRSVGAAVVDEFSCGIYFNGGADVPAFSSQLDLAGVRRSMAEHPYGEDVRVYTSEIVASAGVSLGEHQADVNYKIFYAIAVQLDQAGKAKRASQYTCISKTLQLDTIGFQYECGMSESDPFGRDNPQRLTDWLPVSVENEIPLFAREFPLGSRESMQNGNFELNCVFKGTVR